MTRRTEDQLSPEERLKELEDSHIWLNAFSCIRPSEKFLKEVGEMVVHRLNQTDLYTPGFGEPDERGHRAGESPLIYLRINKS